MKITREINGVVHEFELTDFELNDAYIEREAQFDRMDIENVFYGMSDEELVEEYGADKATIDHLRDEMAEEKRRLMDKYGVDWNYAVSESIRTVLQKHKAECMHNM